MSEREFDEGDKYQEGESYMAKSNRLQSWYHDSITVGQRRLLWIVSGLLILVFGVGLIPLAFLMYLHLGRS